MDELFARENEVTGADRELLAAALLSAYPDLAFFYIRQANKWGVRAADYFDLHRGRIPIVDDIVEHARSKGRTLDLLALAWTDVPGNPQLKALADRFLPDQDGVRAKYAAAPLQPTTGALSPVRPSLEKLVDKRSRLINLSKFEEGMAILSGALCRISAPELRGTGFLVGRKTVLTNFHVMEKAIKNGLDGSNIVCEFDYDGAGKPTVNYSAAPGLAWKGLNSPYSQSDLSGTGEPAADELDFAVVTLASEVEPQRAPLKWPIAPPIVSQRDFIVIGQHPGGDVANIAFGEVVAYPSSGLRYRYDVTTEPGSSGSPVLNLDLELIALHHAGDPAYDAKYNQGVPIWLIRAALKASGFDLDAA